MKSVSCYVLSRLHLLCKQLHLQVKDHSNLSIASSHVESISSNSRWSSTLPEHWGRNARNGAKPQGGCQISPASADPAIAHALTPKPQKSRMILQFPRFFIHFFWWILDVSSSAWLGPNIPWPAHGRPRKSTSSAGRNAAAVFGSSPEALLHQDLLPLLASVKGDEGGGTGGSVFFWMDGGLEHQFYFPIYWGYYIWQNQDDIISGWWFGCHFLCSQKFWECHHPNWPSYFSEGWPNHQPVLVGWLSNQRSKRKTRKWRV